MIPVGEPAFLKANMSNTISTTLSLTSSLSRHVSDRTTGVSNVKEICQWETFNATCGADEIVLVRSARYGRMQQGRCIESDYRIGCDADILLTVDARCSGRHHCTIDIPDSTLHRQVDCLKDILAYMQAEYTCVKGIYRMSLSILHTFDLWGH